MGLKPTETPAEAKADNIDFVPGTTEAAENVLTPGGEQK